MIFGQTTPVMSDRKRKFQRFCPARSDCNNIAHGILSWYKLQDVFSKFTEKIWKLQLKYFSYRRDQRRPFSSTLICITKIHRFVLKNSQNAGVNLAEKAYQCIEHLKNIANPCVCLNLKIDKISFWPLKLRLFVFYVGFHGNWMENRCWLFLKRCINVISGNACALAWLTN